MYPFFYWQAAGNINIFIHSTQILKSGSSQNYASLYVHQALLFNWCCVEDDVTGVLDSGTMVISWESCLRYPQWETKWTHLFKLFCRCRSVWFTSCSFFLWTTSYSSHHSEIGPSLVCSPLLMLGVSFKWCHVWMCQCPFHRKYYQDTTAIFRLLK